MTTREVYFKAYMFSTKPTGILYYTYEDEKGVIQLGESLWLSFSKHCHNDNVAAMEKIEKRKGFMFWNLSDDADEFFEKNKKKLAKHFANMLMMQR